MRLKCHVILLFAALFFSGQLIGQNAQQPFEEVPVQYHRFKWKQISTPGFEIFYYQGGEQLAKAASQHIEKEYLRICELLGYYNFEKMKIIIYLNEAHKAQSNIDRGYLNNPSGGDSYYVKNLAEVAYPGTLVGFKKELSEQIARSVVNEMLYGRGVKEIIRSSHFIRLPEWISEGLPAYLANGWTVDLDAYMYLSETKPRITYLNGLEGNEARLIGQSVWNYIVEQHGPVTIGNIMLLLRSTREVDISISGSIDRSFSLFLNNWHKYYEVNRAFIDEASTVSPEREVDLPYKLVKNYDNYYYSPNRDKVAVTRHKNGRVKVLVYDLKQEEIISRFKKRVRSGLNSNHQETVLSWRNNNDLRILYRSFGEYSLFYNMNKKQGLFHTTKDHLVIRNILEKDFFNKKKLELPRFQNIQNFSYSEDGKQMVLNASNDGVSDVYMMLLGSKKIYQITKDIYDDVDASFLSENEIVFASNRISDSVGYKGSVNEVEDNYDLYVFNISNRSLRQLTNGLGHELMPKAIDDSTLLFLDDNSGVRRVAQLNIRTGEKTGTLNTPTSAKNFFYNKEGQLFLTLPFENGIIGIDPENQIFTSDEIQKTQRQKILEQRTINHQKTADTTRGWVNTFIDTTSNKVVKKTPELTFSVKKTLSSFRIDPIYGSGLVGGVTMTDMFEDYRVDGYIFALTDFSSTIARLEIENRAWRRMDWKLGYERKNVFFGDETTFSKFGIQSMDLKMTIPFMTRLAFTATPSVFLTSSSDIIQFTQPIQRTGFGGVELKLTFNNTVEKRANRIKGTRGVLSFATYKGLLSSDSLYDPSVESFARLNFDLRNYTPIAGNIIWANRFAAGNSFGNAPKNYIFGGMDNWFFPRMALNEIFSNGNASDLFYTTYVTNMRGFGYNARNGTSFFMYNTELRIPLTSLFGSQVIRSSFLNNLQLNVFSDFGSSWTGSNPFTRDNSYNRQTFGGNGNAFTITVLNYRNPIVMGYGFGLRTILFGSYIKADLGFGLEDYQGSTPMLMITLGNDF